jgi:hypothetical protein
VFGRARDRNDFAGRQLVLEHAQVVAQALVDRMRRDVDVQRERARQRGLLELPSLPNPAK